MASIIDGAEALMLAYIDLANLDVNPYVNTLIRCYVVIKLIRLHLLHVVKLKKKQLYSSHFSMAKIVFIHFEMTSVTMSTATS